MCPNGWTRLVVDPPGHPKEQYCLLSQKNEDTTQPRILPKDANIG